MFHPLLVLPSVLTLLAMPAAGSVVPLDEPVIRRVAIVVYEGVELLDFAGPGEVFSAARHPDGSRFEVYTIASSLEPVTSQGFVRVTPQHTFADGPVPDIAVVPGGSIPLRDKELRAWLVRCSQESEIVMSVCNGALALAAAGLLDGREVTTHHGSLDSLQAMAPTSSVFTNRRFVDTGRIVTSAGVSAGIDGALHVVSRLLGAEEARSTAEYMEYEWRPEEIAELHAQPGERLVGLGASAILSRVREDGLEQALVWFAQLDEAPTEVKLNRSGYSLLSAERTDDALALLKFVARAFPDSANAGDSYSDVLEHAGRREEAAEIARRALARIDRDETLGETRLELLRNSLASRVARLSGSVEALGWICPPCGRGCDERRYLRPTTCPDCRMQLVAVEGGEVE